MRLHIAVPEEEYDAEIETGLLRGVGAAVREIPSGRGLKPPVLAGRVAVLSDKRVLEAHGETLAAALRKAELEIHTIVVAEGEAGKTLQAAAGVYESLAEARFERGEMLIAFGGGAIGDLAGFVAATYKRGMRLVQVPTSLVAQVDSCLGGKSALNLHGVGKNLVGVIRQPAAVYVDPALIATLPGNYYLSGLGEIAKYAMIEGGEFFDLVAASLTRPPSPRLRRAGPPQGGRPLPSGEGGGEGGLPALIGACLKIKKRFVEADVNDLGARRLLNFGHTFGHALEIHLADASDLKHGHCVALGILVATRMAMRRGVCDAEAFEQLESLLQCLRLPTKMPAEAEGKGLKSLIQKIGQDKKWQDRALYFVLPRHAGELEIVNDATLEEIETAAREIGGGPLARRGLQPPARSSLPDRNAEE